MGVMKWTGGGDVVVCGGFVLVVGVFVFVIVVGGRMHGAIAGRRAL